MIESYVRINKLLIFTLTLFLFVFYPIKSSSWWKSPKFPTPTLRIYIVNWGCNQICNAKIQGWKYDYYYNKNFNYYTHNSINFNSIEFQYPGSLSWQFQTTYDLLVATVTLYCQGSNTVCAIINIYGSAFIRVMEGNQEYFFAYFLMPESCCTYDCNSITAPAYLEIRRV